MVNKTTQLSLKKGKTGVPPPTNAVPHHLSYAMKAFPMKLKGLLKEDLVFGRPLIREGSEVGQVRCRFLQVMTMPEEHAQCLLGIVPVFILCQPDVLFHWKFKGE